MNRNRVPNGPTLAASCVALGALSGLCSWLVLTHGNSLGALGPYLPGAILGCFACIAGQCALGWPRFPWVRAVGVVLACLAAWPLAQTARQLGGPLPWVSASLVGALGIAIGILVAWPQRVRRGSVLGLMVAAGLAGGLLFTAAGELGLVRSGRSMWSVVLLCSWQAGLLTAAAFTLRRSTRG